MKHIATAFLILAMAGSVARADNDCHVAMDQWQPREAVQTMATLRGWTVNRIKIDDGCYEVRGTDESGRAFKAKIDPATLAIVKIRHRDRDGDHHGSRRDQDRQMETGAAGGVPSNSLFETNSRPKVIVK
ncbi:hypothetical protein AFEL58S_00226 [Afipia felis]